MTLHPTPKETQGANPMIEKAVTALETEAHECGFTVFRDDAESLVRAVLQALREPDEGMIEAGIKQVEECTDDWTARAVCTAEHTWAAMIDHLLNTTD